MIRQVLIICVILVGGFAAGYFVNRRHIAPAAPRFTYEEFSSRRLPSVEIHAATFGETMGEIQAITHSNVVVDWPGMAEHGVDPHTKSAVDISFHDVTIGQFLNRISKATDHQDTHLEWVWRDGLLKWSVEERGSTDFGNDCNDVDSRSTVTCIYDISGLLDNDEGWTRLGISPKSKVIGSIVTKEDRADLVMATLMALVDPDSWRDNGGMDGSMRHAMGKLFVSQTVPNQRAIYSIIQILRSGR